MAMRMNRGKTAFDSSTTINRKVMREPLPHVREGLPSGTLTFLFTDIESSTQLWEQYPQKMSAVMARHDELIESVVIKHGGVIVRPRGEGDSRFAVFKIATAAVTAAGEIQRCIYEENWGILSRMKVRIGIHTGEADLRDGDYYGVAVNRCARLRSIAHGGQTLLSQTTYSLISDSLCDGISVRDLGEHKIKDVKHHQRIYQLILDGFPGDFPPLQTQNKLFTNLPAPFNSFVGRENELAELKRFITTQRLLTIYGPGGVGKTRLGIQAAAELLDFFTDGVWFVDLSPLSNPAHVANYVLSSFGAREELSYSPVQTLVDFLREKVMLLVMDNCEHILKGIVPLVQALLQGDPKLRILATSRTPLGIAGEMVWLIPPLSSPDINGELQIEKILQVESVRLFVDRALAARKDFALTRENASAVAKICAQLDGIPLAIELAAARVRVLSANDIAARLDDRFRFLVNSQDVAPRQKTLRNLIDWSYDLLPENERALLRRLSVFSGGWTLSIAERVCPGEYFEPFEVLDLLANLVDKCLVMTECKEGNERYYFLETIRQYAQARLVESGEGVEYAKQHATTFVEITEEAFDELWGPKQGFWLSYLDLENDNLRTALEWMTRRKDCYDLLLRMTVSLWRYWEIRGYLTEGRSRLDFALANVPNQSKSLRAHGLRGAGMLALQQGDYFQATELHQQSLALFRELGDKLGIGREMDVLGEIAKQQGDYSLSVKLHQESLALRYEIEDKEGVAVSLGHLGIIARDYGENQSAHDLLEESLKLSRELDDKLLIALALKNLGMVAFNICEYPKANEFLEEAVAFYRELKDKLGISETIQILGNIAKNQGDFHRAQVFYQECLELKQELGDKRGIAQALASQAEVDFHQGNYPCAAIKAEQGLKLFTDLGVKRGIVFCMGLQAYIAHYQGDFERAKILAGEVLGRAKEISAPRPIAYAKEVFGLGAYARGDLDEAKALFQEALLIFENLNDRRNIASLWVNLARTAYRQGDHENALDYLKESISLSRELNIRWTISYALEIRGLIEREAGRYELAIQFFLESLNLSAEQSNQQGIANCLGALAGIAALMKQPERGACLFSAAEVLRTEMGMKMGSHDQREYERYLSLLREQMDQGAFEASWVKGRSMTLTQIIDGLKESGINMNCDSDS
jgi:predicted ATPase/class 3 adenylate cyclase